jgi:hypothetical protein
MRATIFVLAAMLCGAFEFNMAHPNPVCPETQRLLDTKLNRSELYDACGLPSFEKFKCKNGKIVGTNEDLSSRLICNFTLIDHAMDNEFGTFSPK